MRHGRILFGVFTLVAAACVQEDTVSPVEQSTTQPTPTRTSDDTSVVLMEGSVEVPAAAAFGDPGFHEPLSVTSTVPADAASTPGTLVVRLRDAGRPDVTCDRDHPLSGCVTVDWSDFEDRPGVPPGGVFDNHLNLVTDDGPVGLFLSESGVLAAAPDDYSPG